MNRRPLGMGKAALLVSGSILLSRLLGLLRNTLLASTLGVTAQGDLYQLAFAIPDLLNYLLAGGFLAITFIPMLTRRMVEGRPQAIWEAFTAVARIVVPGAVLLTVLGMVLVEPLSRILYPGLAEADVLELAALTRIVLPAQIFFVAGGLLMAVQYSHRRFLFPSLAPVIYNLGIICGGLASQTPRGFIYGALGGALVGNLVLQWVGARRLGLRLVSGVEWTHPAVGEYFGLALPLMVGLSVSVLDEQFPRWFGASVGEGGAAALSLARQLNMVPVGLIAQAAGVAALPFLVRLAEESNLDGLRSATTRAVRMGLAVSSLAAAVLVAVAQPAVRLLYQYGKFSAEDTSLVAGLLIIYAISIPAWTAHQIYARAFYAQRKMWSPVLIGTGFTVVAIFLTRWLTEGRGVEGVALASVISMVGYGAVLAVYWHAGQGGAGSRNVLRTAVTVTVAGVVAGYTGLRMTSSLFQDGIAGSLLALIGGLLITAVVWIVLALLTARADLLELVRRR